MPPSHKAFRSPPLSKRQGRTKQHNGGEPLPDSLSSGYARVVADRLVEFKRPGSKFLREEIIRVAKAAPIVPTVGYVANELRMSHAVVRDTVRDLVRVEENLCRYKAKREVIRP